MRTTQRAIPHVVPPQDNRPIITVSSAHERVERALQQINLGLAGLYAAELKEWPLSSEGLMDAARKALLDAHDELYWVGVIDGALKKVAAPDGDELDEIKKGARVRIAGRSLDAGSEQ